MEEEGQGVCGASFCFVGAISLNVCVTSVISVYVSPVNLRTSNTLKWHRSV